MGIENGDDVSSINKIDGSWWDTETVSGKNIMAYKKDKWPKQNNNITIVRFNGEKEM